MEAATAVVMPDDEPGLLEPETFLPAQFFDGPPPIPERRLFLAMLGDAFGVLSRMKPGSQQWLDAKAWFFSCSSRWGTVTFVCDELDFPLTAVRDHARKIILGTVRYARINRVSGTRTNLSRNQG